MKKKVKVNRKTKKRQPPTRQHKAAPEKALNRAPEDVATQMSAPEPGTEPGAQTKESGV